MEALQYDLVYPDLIIVLQRRRLSLLESAGKEQIEKDALVVVKQSAVEDDLVTHCDERVALAYLSASFEERGSCRSLRKFARFGSDRECLEVEACEVRDAVVGECPDGWARPSFDSFVYFAAQEELEEV